MPAERVSMRPGHPFETGFDLLFQIARQVVVLQQDAVLLRNPVQRGHRFRCKADSIPVITDSG